MNDNQKVFEAITGFKNSYTAMGAAQDYNYDDKSEIESVVEGTVDNHDLLDLDIKASNVDVEKVVQAIFDFHACDSGRGIDLDEIFKSLK